MTLRCLLIESEIGPRMSRAAPGGFETSLRVRRFVRPSEPTQSLGQAVQRPAVVGRGGGGTGGAGSRSQERPIMSVMFDSARKRAGFLGGGFLAEAILQSTTER